MALVEVWVLMRASSLVFYAFAELNQKLGGVDVLNEVNR